MLVGLDEAGRGPLAGPVCAAAVILGPDFPVAILDDSKKLSAQKRDAAMTLIYGKALAWGIGWASAAEIDAHNILKASLLAMKRAYEDMAGRRTKNSAEGLEAVIDGLYVPEIPIPSRAVVRADAKYPEVMAASILAKTARDRMMARYAWIYPEYGYEKHKGYPTREHCALVMRYGPSPIQRLSFTVKEPAAK
ncbi:MAG: ribonuclease HII [Spirochaetaceae bacterium]|jgi:ribonuclease HII|nr:ribonuclease HII [Spirochaetaceae bacterium]